MTAATRFALIFAATATTVLTAVAGFVAWADPYMLVWRTQETRGQILDRYMRTAKASQATLRDYDVLLVGSSTTYRGLDPNQIVGQQAYNLGISSLSLTEARHYIDHALLTHRPRTLVLGLEYFMFDTHVQSQPGFDPGLGGFDALIGNLAGAFLSLDAVRHARERQRQQRDDPNGIWHANGFKRSQPPSQAQNQQQLEGAVDWYRKVAVPPDAPAYAALEHIIAQARKHGISLKLYFSPQSPEYLAAIARAGHTQGLPAWQAAVRRIAAREDVPLFDFLTHNPCMHSQASRAACFLDPSHYAPDTQGVSILAALGFETRYPPGPWAMTDSPPRPSAP